MWDQTEPSRLRLARDVMVQIFHPILMKHNEGGGEALSITTDYMPKRRRLTHKQKDGRSVMMNTCSNLTW